jgi:hypothetical protein
LECCLPLITFLDTDIIISQVYIELGEVLHALELMDQVVDEGEGVSILSHDGINSLIFLDKVEHTILFLDEED